jgi:hypothetical protein
MKKRIPYRKEGKPVMQKMIACCGLVCSSCPSFLATQSDDDDAREKAAAFYSEKLGLDLKPEEINCDGCLSEGGNLLKLCRSCEIRDCCRAKAIENCAYCMEQPCEKLTKFHKFSSHAKGCFDALLKEIG